MSLERNEYGIPLRCIDCPTIAPTVEEVRDIESAEFVLAALTSSEDKLDRFQVEMLSGKQDDIDHLRARKMVKLGLLLDRSAGCRGAKLYQEKMPNGEHIHHIACGC